MGAQARQAAGPEQAAAAGGRQLPDQGWTAGGIEEHSLRDHAGLRYAAAAGYGGAHDWNAGAPVEFGDHRSEAADGDAGLRHSAAAGGRERGVGVAVADGGAVLGRDR